MKSLLIHIPESTHIEIKIYAVYNSMTVKDLILTALKEYMQAHPLNSKTEEEDLDIPDFNS